MKKNAGQDLLEAFAAEFAPPPDGAITARQLANHCAASGQSISRFTAAQRLKRSADAGELQTRLFKGERYYWK